ncbi:TPA: hypothetical protein ACN976_003794 [Vibrio campbellii]
MPQLARDTNRIADELLSFLNEGIELNEIQRARYVRAANNHDSAERREAIFSLIYTLDGRRDCARQHAMSALECMTEPATLAVSLLSLHLNKFHKDALSVRADFDTCLEYPLYAVAFGPSIQAVPDFKSLMTIYESFTKVCGEDSRWDEAMEVIGMCKHYFSKAKEAEEKLQINAEILDLITDFAADVADTYAGVLMRSTTFELSPVGDAFDVLYKVQLDEEFEHELVDLNLALADRIIDADLDDLPLVARFSRLTEKAPCLSESLVLGVRK